MFSDSRLVHEDSRKMSLRLVVLAALYLLVVALAAKHDGSHGLERRLKSPQETYEDEQRQYPSVFQSFVSTLNRIRPPASPSNPKVFDDPRVPAGASAFLPKIYRPYSDYQHRGSFCACEGPRGKLLNDSLDDQVGAYLGIPDGFPEPMLGSHDAVGLDGGVSFDRYSRYGAYGFGEDEPAVENWIKPARVNWDEVSWGALQHRCVDRNAGRFDKAAGTHTEPSRSPESRSAVLIRTYMGKEYSENDIHAIRAIVSELALQSGGEYSVFLLLHVKNDHLPIWNERARRKIVQGSVPREFWDITELWSVPLVASRYPELDRRVTDVHHAQWLPVQDFALRHPEFEYIWNWEIDSRYTGHNYEFVDKVTEFARRQPRRGMWERNARFYIPRLHGTHSHSFVDSVRRSEAEAIWGPFPVDDSGTPPPLRVQPSGPAPPVRLAQQDTGYNWGVGEEADYISFLPMFHPVGTDWVIRNEVYGYLGSDTPRRASLITHARLSRRLLLTMHDENRLGRHMGSELFPASTALLHGLKAVVVPHPIYSDKPLPPASVDRWFNSGVNGRAGSTKGSPFSWGRETRFRDISWYYRANLPGRLYWPFLGWTKDGVGGPSFEAEHGRVCLPSILFHPVKDVHPEADSTHYLFDSELGLEARPGP